MVAAFALACFQQSMPRMGRRKLYAVPEDAPKWLAIDAFNVVYRSFYAYKDLSHIDMPTGAILGTANVLLKHALVHNLSGGRVIWAVESRKKTWRKEMDSSYKATRQSMPNDLRLQLDPIAQFAEAFGTVSVEVPGQEADDVIATLAERHAEDGVLILAEDKDLYQLVTPNVRILRKKGILDVDGVVEAFGIPPEQVPDFLAMTGDVADNVPGIKGIGPKTAAKLLNTFGNLETILEQGPTQADTKSVRAKLAAVDLDDIYRWRRLVRLDRDCALPPTYYPDTAPSIDWDKLHYLADNHGLLSFKKKLVTAQKAANL